MNSNEILKKLPTVLLPWFAVNKRDLPWREDRDPYHIWLSEIMLQQTRVEAVKGYYGRFLKEIPSIASLSNATDDVLTKLWEGLGYYSRVRNLKKAAIVIEQRYNGIFPENYSQIRELPGIGDYTAGAICSIAFGEKTPAVDGNVLRVYSRLMNDSSPIDSPEMKRRVRDELALIYPDEAGEFTQALMELGATICGPNKKPDCGNCPCRDFCISHQMGTSDQLPIKLPKNQRKQENITVFILRCGELYALQKRSNTGLLAGLWQFPNVSGHMNVNEAADYLGEKGILVADILRQNDKIHIFTHIQWNMRGLYMKIKEPTGEYCWLTEDEIQKQYALPTAFRMFWDDRQIFLDN